LVVAPLAAVGCLYLFFSLSNETKLMFVGWAAVGLIVYFLYGYRNSHLGRGIVEVPELSPDIPPESVPPMPGAPPPGSY
jgi:APA family basic amino acid/polyamine antiporter